MVPLTDSPTFKICMREYEDIAVRLAKSRNRTTAAVDRYRNENVQVDPSLLIF